MIGISSYGFEHLYVTQCLAIPKILSGNNMII